MEPFLEGVAHGGFAHATEQLLQEVAPIIDQAFAEHGMAQTEVKLMIVGHSLGAAIGIMAGLKLREKFPNLECWAFSTPACLTLELAQKCRDFVTSFISNYDIVPRFSLHSVELLRKQVCSFDWDRAEKILKDDEDWKNIKSASEAMRKWQETQKGIGETVQSAQDGLCEQVTCIPVLDSWMSLIS
jgi:sn1-specific diacylglycerol lipase